jgi:hypothetical protein
MNRMVVRWVLTEDMNMKKVCDSGFHCLYLMCKFGFWGLAMPCVEVLPEFQNCITVNILKMKDLEDAVFYSVGLVGVWNMVLCKAVFLIISGTVNPLQSL